MNNSFRLRSITMQKISLAIILCFTLFSSKALTNSTTQPKNIAAMFFHALSAYCGKTLTGKTTFPNDPNHDFANKALVLNFASCKENKIKVPFAVGNDHSRTWIITLNEGKLSLKHDHRHKDGSPDEVTNYGGTANTQGTKWQQHFPADEFTTLLIPAAATNIWTLTINLETKTLTYGLTRHGKDRYRAIFKL